MNDKIAIYLRLSLADGDLKKGSKDESNSIENQRMLLHDYIGKQEDLFGEIVEYVDDGYTGTNFNRPAFQKMIVDLKQGDIKVIMVKDLSRLGRDYIGVGDYIEQIFPLMGVRFIAVNNSFDSMRLNNGTPGIEVAVSNLVNNMYSRDIAKKIRAALETNWKNGKATCTNIKGSKTAKGHTASCSVVLGCFATYWVAKGNSCYLMGSSQNATNAL